MMVMFGNAPVPWGAMWSKENEYYVGRCPGLGVVVITAWKHYTL